MRLHLQWRHLQQIGAVAVIAAIILFIFSYFLSHEYSKQAIQDVNAITQSKMEHITQNTKLTLDHYRVYGLSIGQDDVIKQWLISNKIDRLLDVEALQGISKFASLQPFVSSIYLVNAKTDRVLNSSIGVRNFDSFEDQDMLTLIEQTRPKYVSYIHHAVGNNDYIGLLIPSEDRLGYIVVLLEQNAVEDFLFQKNDSISTHIYDQQGNHIMGEALPVAPSLLVQGSTSDMPLQELTLDNRTIHITTTKLELYKWNLHFVTDPQQMTKNIAAFQNKITIACLVFLFLLLIVIVWNSMITISPFRKLAQELQSRLGEKAPLQGEVEIIRHGFNYLIESVNQMNSSLQHYSDLAQEHMLRQWILQGTRYEAGHEGNLSPLMTLSSLRLVVIRIESYKLFADKYNFMSRKLFKYAIGNIAEEILRNRGLLTECIDMDGDHLVILIGCEQLQAREDIEDELLRIYEQVNKWLNIATAIALSEEVSHQYNLRKLYDMTYELTFLKFLTGTNKVYSELDRDENLGNSQGTSLDEGLLNELITSVKQGDQEQVSNLIEELIHQLKSYSYRELQFQLKFLFYMLFKSFSKVSSMQETVDTTALLNQFASLQELADWLHKELTTIMNEYQDKKNSSRKDEIVQEMIQYIKNHTQDPTLNVDSIGEHLGLSTSYIRHVFKEVADITLSDYILNERIDKVKQLLETTELAISEIAESTGFQTKSHFFNVFKKATGLTPSQYRALEKQVTK